VLERLAQRDLYAITSFIFGMDNDTKGVADRTLQQIQSWPPGLPVFGQLTPFPATPLYERLQKAGRLTRPKHWLEFAPYQMAHTPLKMSIPDTQLELDHAWQASYSPERNAQALAYLKDKSVGWRIYHLILRLSFRGIYFPQMGPWAWTKVIARNRAVIFGLAKESVSEYRKKKKKQPAQAFNVAEDSESLQRG